MSDLIDRQAAIDTLDKHLQTTDVPVSYPGIISALTEWLNELPSAQPEQTNSWCINSWCIDCKEYDTEKHSCPRFNRVIKQTLDEIYMQWIPCSERLPEPRKAVLGYAPRYQNIYALYYDSAYGWMIWNPLRDDCFPNSQGEIVAWMPLPEPYREEGEK